MIVTDEGDIPAFNGTTTNEYQNNNGNPPYNNNPSANTSANSVKLYKLNGAAGVKTGLGITLRVMSGDVVDIFGKSFYHLNSGQTPTNTYNIASSALMALITNFAGSNPVQALHSGITSNDLTNNPNNGVTEWLTSVPTPDQSVHHTPKAYINWVLLDDRFEVVTAGSGFDLVSLNPDVLKSHHKTVSIPQNGYLYVYCSNESDIDLFFDNLQVIQTHGPLVEETHYYPFGLTMAGISSQALNFGTPENNKLYNKGSELQHHEFSDGSGLETYTTQFRMLDPQLGRWWQVDPETDREEMWSPYSSDYNNPIIFNDPLGDEPDESDGDCCDWNSAGKDMKAGLTIAATMEGGSGGFATPIAAFTVIATAVVAAGDAVGLGNTNQTIPTKETATVKIIPTNNSGTSSTEQPVILTQKEKQQIINFIQGSGQGRGKNNRTPDPEATGDHTVSNDKGSTTYKKNDKNPTGFQEEKRVDTKGKAHNDVPTPHVHEPGKKVRPANPDEVPKTDLSRNKQPNGNG